MCNRSASNNIFNQFKKILRMYFARIFLINLLIELIFFYLLVFMLLENSMFVDFGFKIIKLIVIINGAFQRYFPKLFYKV